MTHSLHRHGTEESLKGDYTFNFRACEVKREGGYKGEKNEN